MNEEIDLWAGFRPPAWLQHSEFHPEIASTNDRARELLEQQTCPAPAVVVAARQTQGRGRGANRWWTGPGALAFSLALDPAQWRLPRRDTPQISLATALAVIDAVAPHTGAAPLGLHWPNDVFLAGRKLAGILVEGLADGRCVIGVGINTNNSAQDAPESLQATVVTLRDLVGGPVEHPPLLAELLENLDGYLTRLGLSGTSLGELYQSRCLQIGASLTIRVGEQVSHGRCLGIGEDGALLLDSHGGAVQRFYGGVLVK